VDERVVLALLKLQHDPDEFVIMEATRSLNQLFHGGIDMPNKPDKQSSRQTSQEVRGDEISPFNKLNSPTVLHIFEYLKGKFKTTI
jgi:hypothetical protein